MKKIIRLQESMHCAARAAGGFGGGSDLQVGVEMRQPLHGVVDYDESRAAAEAAAWRTALLIELRLRLPEIAKTVPDGRPAA
jgi:hypothetical protein